MNWNDLQSVWRQQPLTPTPSLDPAEVRRTFEAKSRQWARRLFWRDFAEASAGVLVALVLGLAAWRQGPAYWPNGIALLLILGVTGFFIRERVRVRRSRVAPQAPLLTKLEADLAELRRQRHLLVNVGKWYLGPLMAAVLIFVGTATYEHRERLQYRAVQVFLVSYLAFCALLTSVVYRMNQRAARTKLEPRIAELERLHQDLLSS